jgi:uncharacterized protein YkwD
LIGARPLLPLLACVSFLGVSCGVPISAADLTRTPQATPDSLGLSQVALASKAADPQSAPTQRSPASAPVLTAQPSLTPPATPTTAAGTATGAAASATATPTPSGPPPSPTPTPDPSAMVSEALQVLNKYRADSGRPQLRLDPNLAAAAAAYAKVMGDNSWFTRTSDPHTGPDGSQPETRIARAGYGGRFLGEALAAGQATGRDVVYGWLNSPPHAAIILDSNAVDVGIGYYYKPGDYYGAYWVLVTGVP